MELRDKVVLLTGASQGIGEATARLLQAKGARLALVARSRERLEALARPEDLAIAADLTIEQHRIDCIAKTTEKLGRIDVLINNAGVGMYIAARRAPMAQVRHMFELNFFAPLHLIQLAVPEMIKQGGGFIVNVSSVAGKMALPWLTVYSASKFALGALSEGLRVELAPLNIRVLTVCPGYVKTGFQAHSLGGEPPERIQRGRRFAITADRVARALIRGIEKEKRTVVVPWYMWLVVGLARLVPGFVEREMRHFYRAHEPQP